MEIGFSYGVLCDKLEKQANEKGFTLGKDSEKLEEIRKSIHVLIFNNIITDKQREQVFKKLHSKAVKALKPLKESEVE